MHRRHSTRLRRRRNLLLLLLLILLISLVSCESSKPVSKGTASALIGMLPEMPTPPTFPTGLNWGIDNTTGLWTLDDAGTDAILNFRDNLYGYPEERGYLFQLESWTLQLQYIHNRIIELGI